MNSVFLLAFGMMLVFEGIMPLLFPKAWRESFQRMTSLKDGQLRFVGLLSFIAGCVIIMLSK